MAYYSIVLTFYGYIQFFKYVYQELDVKLQHIIQIQCLYHGLKEEIHIFQIMQQPMILKQFMQIQCYSS